ncbi:unnamed protein product, partial [Strongylus vulgaris]
MVKMQRLVRIRFHAYRYRTRIALHHLMVVRWIRKHHHRRLWIILIPCSRLYLEKGNQPKMLESSLGRHQKQHHPRQRFLDLGRSSAGYAASLLVARS